MVYVYEDTYSTREKWRNIGLCLKLTPSTLSAIEADFRTCAERHRQSLEEWVKRDCSATMMKLIRALKNEIVHENQLAQKLETKYHKQDKSINGKLLAHSMCQCNVY